jgi:AraC-like DNA-binding protein
MGNPATRQQARNGTLRVGGAVEILSVLKSLGFDPGEILTEAGIPPDLFDDPENLITYASRGHLMKHCVSKTGCQHFGLLVGQRMDLHSLGLLGLLMRSQTDAGAALDALISYLHLHSQGALTTLEVDQEVAILTYSAVQPMVEATDQTGDGAVAMMLNVMRTLCGPDFKPIEASFAHRKPVDVTPFRQFFRVPLYFDTEHYSLIFAPDWLQVRLPHGDQVFKEMLRRQFDALEANQRLEFPEQVRAVLRSALMTGHCSESQIAALFSISDRTLGRRLQSFGTSFQLLFDESRFEVARQMLENTSLTVGQIASSLAYSRASAFIRAFRRWSGTTPGEWRNALQ